MIPKRCRCDKGFTVVELLIYLSLLLIILTAGYSFFGFGLRSYYSGEERAIAQQGVRNGTDFISRELRYADSIVLTDTAPSSIDDSYYIYVESGSIIYQNTEVKRVIADGNADNLNYMVSFSERLAGGTSDFTLVLNFVVEAEDVYDLETNVYVLNLDRSDNYNNDTGGNGSASVVKFTKP